MRIYVAAAFGRKDWARAVMEQARKRGHEVTHDWTMDNPEADEADLSAMAEACLNGIRRADGLLVILTPECRGTIGEWVAGLILGKPVVCCAENFTEWHDMIFYYHSDVWPCSTADGALDTLEEMVCERQAVQRVQVQGPFTETWTGRVIDGVKRG